MTVKEMEDILKTKNKTDIILFPDGQEISHEDLIFESKTDYEKQLFDD